MPMSVECTICFCVNYIMIETRQFCRNKSIRAKKLTSVNSYVPSILRFGENLLKKWIGKHDHFFAHKNGKYVGMYKSSERICKKMLDSMYAYSKSTIIFLSPYPSPLDF